jgi:CheY-like chemotaxis protein
VTHGRHYRDPPAGAGRTAPTHAIRVETCRTAWWVGENQPRQCHNRPPVCMQAGPASAASASSTLLVVNDEPAGLYVKRVALERAGFSVLEASTGAEALAVVAAKSPDLVILDVKLPDVDGFQVCREIKRNPRTAATMVLQVSAHYTSANDHVQGLE